MQYKGRLEASAIDWMLINPASGWNRSVMASNDRCFLPDSQHWNDTHPSWADSLCLNPWKNLSYPEIQPMNTKWSRPAAEIEGEEEEE